MSSTAAETRDPPRGEGGGRHPGRGQQRPAAGRRARGPRHRLDERVDVHGRRRSCVHRLPLGVRSAPARPQRPRRGRRRRGAGRTVDLMGVGVTQVEVELAERLVAAVPSVEKVLLTATGSEATFHALRVARTATGRRHVLKFQGCYHGWHDSGGDERDLARRARRVEGPALAGDPARGPRRHDRVPVQRRGRGGARSPSTTWPRSSSSRSRTTSARCCRSRASSSGCASSRRSTGRCSSSTR